MAGPEEAARLRRWWDGYSATLGGLEVTADPEMPFVTRVDYLQLGAVGLGRSSGSINRFYRGPNGVSRDAHDLFQLVINRGGTPSLGVGSGWRNVVPPGSAILFDFAGHAENVCPGGHSVNAVALPRKPLMEAVRDIENRIGSLVRHDNDALRLLVTFVDAALSLEGLSQQAVVDRAGQTLMDLVVLALGANRENTEIAGSRGLRAARLEAALRLVGAAYSDPEISPTKVAVRLGISTRYLHKLFHETGASFAERVQELRLERAFALLSGETRASRKVHEAAYDAGFSDLSHFNRLFRRKYGLTPTAARGR
jgi:AraC-like DNA-binding protein